MDDAKLDRVHPLFGVECHEFDLRSLLSPASLSDSQNSSSNLSHNRDNAHVSHNNQIEEIRHVIHKNKLVIFRNQGVLTAEEQIQLSELLGEIEISGFEQHPKSPDRRLLLVSNDPEYGFQDFGTTGFHVDGSFMEKPNSYSMYHILKCPTKGSTAFVSLGDVYDNLPAEKKLKWERLWILKTFKHISGYTDEPGYVIHPLVYTHPASKLKTLCIHQGKTSRIIWDWGSDIGRCASKQETEELLSEIDAEILKQNCYTHQWAAGDLLISDNLALAHMALPDTQLAPSVVGLRVMRRVVLRGVTRPWKNATETLREIASSTSQSDDSDADWLSHREWDESDADDNQELARAYSHGDAQKLAWVKRRLKLCSRDS